MESTAAVSESDWLKGISLSILASVIGGASKLAIRKSWLMEAAQEEIDIDNTANVPIEEEEESNDAADRTNNNPNSTSEPGEEEPSSASGINRNHSIRQCHSTSSLANGDEEERILVDETDSDNGHDTIVTKKRNWVALSLRGSGMIGMTILNPACCVLAMNYASPSILAPFSGLTLVWIVLFSRIIGEKPSLNQVIAASLIVMGEIIVALFGDHTNDESVTLQDVRKSYLYLPFMAYLLGLMVWMLLLWRWMHANGDSRRQETLRRFAWGVAGGSVTGLQNFLKDSLTILKATKVDDAARPYPWYFPVMMLLAAGSAFGGLLFLTACMKRYDATYSSAMFVGSFVVSASIMSAAHYATFEHLTSLWNWVLYPMGLVVLMGGVFILVQEKGQQWHNGPNELFIVSHYVSQRQPLMSEDQEDQSETLPRTSREREGEGA